MTPSALALASFALTATLFGASSLPAFALRSRSQSRTSRDVLEIIGCVLILCALIALVFFVTLLIEAGLTAVWGTAP